MLKTMWRLWAKSLGEKQGETDSEADAIAIIRSVVVLVNFATCFVIIAGNVHNWQLVKPLKKYILTSNLKKVIILKWRSSSSLSATFTCGIPTPTNGKVTMALPYSASTGLTAGRFFYDLEIYTSSGSVVSRLLYGEVTLTQEVTR